MKKSILILVLLSSFMGCFQKEDRVQKAKDILQKNGIELEQIMQEVKSGKIKLHFKLFENTFCLKDGLRFGTLSENNDCKKVYDSIIYQVVNSSECKIEILGYRKKIFKQIEKDDITRSAKEQKQDRRLNSEYIIKFKYCGFNFELELKDKLYIVS